LNQSIGQSASQRLAHMVIHESLAAPSVIVWIGRHSISSTSVTVRQAFKTSYPRGSGPMVLPCVTVLSR
jgi:hypothetical protein